MPVPIMIIVVVIGIIRRVGNMSACARRTSTGTCFFLGCSRISRGAAVVFWIVVASTATSRLPWLCGRPYHFPTGLEGTKLCIARIQSPIEITLLQTLLQAGQDGAAPFLDVLPRHEGNGVNIEPIGIQFDLARIGIASRKVMH